MSLCIVFCKYVNKFTYRVSQRKLNKFHDLVAQPKKLIFITFVACKAVGVPTPITHLQRHFRGYNINAKFLKGGLRIKQLKYFRYRYFTLFVTLFLTNNTPSGGYKLLVTSYLSSLQTQIDLSAKMLSCKGTTEIPKLLLITKTIIHLGLFVAFVSLSILALLDFLSYETTYRISREDRNMSLPSFTLCAYSRKGIFDKNQLANGAMGNGESLPMPITFILSEQIGQDPLRRMDLTNSSTLEDYFNVTYKKTWSFACKTDFNSKDACWPCITFNAPTLKAKRSFTEVSSHYIFSRT